jgi:DNA polymerase III alpha subunit
MDGTQLNDRFLWFDGCVSLDADFLANYILKGNALKENLFVNEVTDEVRQFNRVSTIPLTIKEKLADISNNWTIPKNYLKLDIRTWLETRLNEELATSSFSTQEIAERRLRVDEEWAVFESFGLETFLAALIYIVDTFREKNVVWGVGRGSSCASYILYLIGVHDVDSVTYELDIHEFLR